MAEHAIRYSRFASELTDSGYTVFAHDYRGHGFTEVNDAPQGVFAESNGFSMVLEDQKKFIS